jgi:hypothetical protein
MKFWKRFQVVVKRGRRRAKKALRLGNKAPISQPQTLEQARVSTQHCSSPQQKDTDLITTIVSSTITSTSLEESSSTPTTASSDLQELPPFPEPPTPPTEPSTPPASPSPPSSIRKSLVQSTEQFIMPSAPTEADLRSLVSHLQSLLTAPSVGKDSTITLLSRGKLALLHLNALLPTPETPASLLTYAREILELGALLSIRIQDADGFIRYFQQLQPFYQLPDSRFAGSEESRSRAKITGLYLLLLLSQQDYLGFHMVLESLELLASAGNNEIVESEDISYPVRLERALMEGSYDRVWGEITGERVPGPEFGVFSEASLFSTQARHSLTANRY